MNGFKFVNRFEYFEHFYGKQHKLYGNCNICNKEIMAANKERLLKKYGKAKI